MPTPIKLYENGRMQVNGEIIEFPPELVGGRNLVLNSRDEINFKNTIFNYALRLDVFKALIGKTLTISFFAKSIAPGQRIDCYLRNTEAGAIISGAQKGAFDVPTDYTFYSYKFILSDISGINTLSFALRNTSSVSTVQDTVYVKELKIENNDRDTIWTPAPEDLGLNIPSWVVNFSNASFNEKGVLSRGLIESPTDLNGNPNVAISIAQEGISVSEQFSEFPNVVTDGLKLWYDFKGMGNDSRNKEIAFDISGNGNDGTLSGFGFNGTSGYSDGLVFDSIGDIVTVRNPLSYQTQLNQQFTIDVVLKLDVTDKTTQLLFSGISQGIYLVSIGKAYPLLYLNSGTDDYYVYGNKDLRDGLYHHVTFVFNNNKDLRHVYRDGVSIVSDAGPNKTGTPQNMSNTITMGSGLLGKICSVRIYDRDLTLDEIKYNYEVEKGRWN